MKKVIFSILSFSMTLIFVFSLASPVSAVINPITLDNLESELSLWDVASVTTVDGGYLIDLEWGGGVGDPMPLYLYYYSDVIGSYVYQRYDWADVLDPYEFSSEWAYPGFVWTVTGADLFADPEDDIAPMASGNFFDSSIFPFGAEISFKSSLWVDINDGSGVADFPLMEVVNYYWQTNNLDASAVRGSRTLLQDGGTWNGVINYSCYPNLNYDYMTFGFGATFDPEVLTSRGVYNFSIGELNLDMSVFIPADVVPDLGEDSIWRETIDDHLSSIEGSLGDIDNSLGDINDSLGDINDSIQDNGDAFDDFVNGDIESNLPDGSDQVDDVLSNEDQILEDTEDGRVSVSNNISYALGVFESFKQGLYFMLRCFNEFLSIGYLNDILVVSLSVGFCAFLLNIVPSGISKLAGGGSKSVSKSGGHK